MGRPVQEKLGLDVLVLPKLRRPGAARRPDARAGPTPDPETGIGNVTKDQFVSRFKSYESMTELPPAPPHRNTIMSWPRYAKIPADDLGSIYDYLRTVKPITNKVNPFPDAT